MSEVNKPCNMAYIFFLQEIEHLTYLEQYTLSSDLSQGYALKMLAGG